MESKDVIIEIHTEYIELQQLLKILNLISSGGQAKQFLNEYDVLVDGIKETRRGRKIYNGMKVKVDKKTYLIKKQW